MLNWFEVTQLCIFTLMSIELVIFRSMNNVLTQTITSRMYLLKIDLSSFEFYFSFLAADSTVILTQIVKRYKMSLDMLMLLYIICCFSTYQYLSVTKYPCTLLPRGVVPTLSY